MQKQDRPVAFFDSGLGGISVLRETVRLLPQENYLWQYFFRKSDIR